MKEENKILAMWREKMQEKEKKKSNKKMEEILAMWKREKMKGIVEEENQRKKVFVAV